MRFVYVLTVAALLCGVVSCQESEKKNLPDVEFNKEIPLADVKLNFKKLDGKKLVYGLNAVFNPKNNDQAPLDALAKVNLNRTYRTKIILSTKAGKKDVVMDYKLDNMIRKLHYLCVLEKNALLSPLSMTAKMFVKDELARTVEVKFENDKMLVKVGQQNLENEFASNTVLLNSLFYIIPQLPKTKGVSYVFDNFSESTELYPQKPTDGDKFKIECMGQQNVNIGGNDVKCVKYSVKGIKKPMNFLVDKTGVVRAVTARDHLLLPTSGHVAETGT